MSNKINYVRSINKFKPSKMNLIDMFKIQLSITTRNQLIVIWNKLENRSTKST